MPPLLFWGDYMTLEDLKLRIEKHFAGLSSELNVPDDELLKAIMDEGVALISRDIVLDETKEKILLPVYVVSRLLERKGYIELSNQYWSRFMQLYGMFKRVFPKDQTPTSVDYTSIKRVFTDDELGKW